MLNIGSLARGFASTVAMRVASAVASFAIFVLLARQWDSTTLGEFATVFATYMFLQQLPLLGLHLVFIRELAQRQSALAETAPALVGVGLVSSAFFALGVGLSGQVLYPPSMQPAFWLAGLALVPTALACVGEAALIADGRMARAATIAAGENIGRAMVWALLLWRGQGVTAMFAALAIVRLLVTGVYFIPADMRGTLRPSGFDWRTALRLLRASPTFLGILLLSAGISRLDVIALSLMGGLEQVAMYSAAYKFHEAALMLPSTLALTLYPVLARAHGRLPPADFNRLVYQILRVCVMAGTPCGVALAFLARPLLVGFYGARFEPAATVLAVLAIGPMLVALEQTLANVLVVQGQERLDLRTLSWACAFYGVALVLLIPKLGFRGAAFATLAALVVQLGVRYLAVRTRLGAQNLGALAIGPAVGAALMVVTVFALRALSLPAAIAAGAGLYIVTLAAFGAVTLKDVQFVRQSWRQPREAL